MIEVKEREPLARQDAPQPSPLPPPTSLGPLPKFASESDVSKEPSRVVSGRACACIGLSMMTRKSCSRAETHASQAPCLRRPRSAPCHRLRARSTSARSPAGWSRGTLALALAICEAGKKGRTRTRTSGEDRYGPSTVPAAKATGPVFGFLRAREREREGEEGRGSLLRRRRAVDIRAGLDSSKQALMWAFCSPLAMARARHPRSRAETHADQVLCLRRPRSAPCQSSRARSTSAKNPAGWSRVALALASG